MDSGLNYKIEGNRDVPNYRNFLKSSTNKASVASFICQYICDNGQDLLPAEKSVVLAGGFEDGEVVKVLYEVGVSSLEGFTAHKRRRTLVWYCMQSCYRETIQG